jgi:hypothetical protein
MTSVEAPTIRIPVWLVVMLVSMLMTLIMGAITGGMVYESVQELKAQSDYMLRRMDRIDERLAK